jgi:CRP-like cAMP-binding protein
MREVTYRAGDVLFTEGDYSTEAYILRRGRVEVYVTRAGTDRRLAVLHEGAVFGELALITDQVRTASVRALDDAQLLAIDQDGFLELWRHHPEALLPLLRVIFERVRDIVSLANELSVEDRNRAMVAAHLGETESVAGHTSERMPHVVIEGATTATREVLEDAPLTIPRFPYRIGGDGGSDRLFVHNDLVLPPRDGATVARSHCMFVNVDGRCFLIDRGTRTGTFVNGERVGGARAPSRVELAEGRSEVAVGGSRSPRQVKRVAADRHPGRVPARRRGGPGHALTRDRRRVVELQHELRRRALRVGRQHVHRDRAAGGDAGAVRRTRDGRAERLRPRRRSARARRARRLHGARRVLIDLHDGRDAAVPCGVRRDRLDFVLGVFVESSG